MTKNQIVNTSIAIAQLGIVRDGVDSGSGPAKIRFYDGVQPASPDVAPSGPVIFEFTCQDPAFSAPVSSSPGAECNLNGTPLFALALESTSLGVGFVRYVNSNNVAYWDGSCGTVAGQFDAILTKLNFVLGEQLQLDSPYVLHQNQGPLA